MKHPSSLNDIISLDPRTARVAGKVGEAIKAIAPIADHLHQWLLDETAAHPAPDREWILGVLKETIADQRPDIPMTWLDSRLPTVYYGMRDGEDQPERTTAT